MDARQHTSHWLMREAITQYSPRVREDDGRVRGRFGRGGGAGVEEPEQVGAVWVGIFASLMLDALR